MFSLCPNIGLAVFDIASDSYLVVEYHGNMTNTTIAESKRFYWFHQIFFQVMYAFIFDFQIGQ